jgi:hypothetical protein
MADKLQVSKLSLAELRQYVNLKEHEPKDWPWLNLSQIDLTDQEKLRIQFVQSDLVHRRVQLMNEATVWARAIYPLLLLAEAGDIQAHAGVGLSAQYLNFGIEAIADGVLGTAIAGSIESPYIVVVEAKRGIEAQNPLFQLYAELLAAAHLNWKSQTLKMPDLTSTIQEVFGCYTVANVWTFLRAEVSGFEAEKPSLIVEFSQEFSEKTEAETICRVLKAMVRRFAMIETPEN